MANSSSAASWSLPTSSVACSSQKMAFWGEFWVSRARRVGRWVGVAGLLALAGCQKQEAGEPKPTAPDMRGVAQQFSAPTGTVSKESVGSALQTILGLGQTLERLSLGVQLKGTLAAVGTASQDKAKQTSSAPPGLDLQGAEPGLTTEAFGVDGEGWIKVSRICNGWGAQPSPDPANGALHLYAGFSDKGLDPVVWGTSEACRYPAVFGDKTYRIQIDASAPGQALSVYLGDNLSFQGLDGQPVIVSLNGKVTIEEISQDLAADFLVDLRDGSVEFAVPVPDGNLLVKLTGEGLFQVRAVNGTFQCSSAKRSCTLPGGQEVSF